MNGLPCNPIEIKWSVAEGGKSITFQPCGTTSHNINDVTQRYCARCDRFMDLVELARELCAIHEYAGFRYYVDVDAIGTVRMVPVEGQHWAASKDKHIRAARETYMAERKKPKA
jgi:hypothetical protein